MHQITKIKIIINNIIQDQAIVIGKVATSQTEIIDIINKFIIKTIDPGKMLWDVFVVEKRDMLGMIVLYGRRLSKKRRSSKLKVGVNMAMVEWD